ncbi:MAG: large-conductance mechanosensitive channel protein MscL [Oscillospiraceae bacterium]
MGIKDNLEGVKEIKGVKKIGGIVSEFKAFISRGNVIDLAVGVIVGSAFTAIVTSLVKDILMPLIGVILAGVNFNSLGVTIPFGNKPYINFGSFIQALIVFLITAMCVFVLVKIINSLSRKKDEAPAEPPAPAADIVLLTEIRDLLAAQKKDAE